MVLNLIKLIFVFSAVQHERAPRAAISASQCPTIANTRRHGYGFSTHGTFLGPTGPLIDMPAYHLIYPQPTFPFHFGMKPHGLGLPNGLGLGIFNCSSPLTSPTVRAPVCSFSNLLGAANFLLGFQSLR